MRTTYFTVEGASDFVVQAVNLDALAETVVRTRAGPFGWRWLTGQGPATGAAYDPEIVLTPLRSDPARIKVSTIAEIDDLLDRMGAPPHRQDCHAWGVCAAPRYLAVIRLDWRPLVAHELSHLIDRLLGLPVDERMARRMEDAV